MSTLGGALHLGTDPETEARLDAYRLALDIAQLVYDLRTDAALTQEQLAETLGIDASEVSQLEDADYEGDPLPMLGRIANALGRRLLLGVAPAGLESQPRKAAAGV
jgi:transcriptional regulator with XRE-family HTH domain